MNIDEAIKELNKHCPCHHDALVELGTGEYVRCEDCYVTMKESSVEKFRKESERFEESMAAVEELVNMWPPGLIDLIYKHQVAKRKEKT